MSNNIGNRIPTIGQAQPQVDVTQAIRRSCVCGNDIFDKAFRVGVISKLAPGNTTNLDLLVDGIVYVCRACGHELLAPVEPK